MILNLTRHNTVSENPFFAANVWTRLRGMIGRRFERFDAMVFEGCSAVHTCWMTLNLDVIFTDAASKVVGMKESLKPWCLCCTVPGAVHVIELPEGRIRQCGIQTGDQLDFGLLSKTPESSCVSIQVEPETVCCCKGEKS